MNKKSIKNSNGLKQISGKENISSSIKLKNLLVVGLLTIILFFTLAESATAFAKGFGDTCAGISTGNGHTCVLKSTGNVHCYGRNDEGQANDYTGGDAVGVSAGGGHTCVLKSNGNVTCYGRNDEGQANDYTGGDAVCSILHPPNPLFVYSPSNPVINQKIIFNASNSNNSDGNIARYEWDFGDGSNGTGEIVTHTYSNTGKYNVTLKVTDNDRVAGTYTQEIKVNCDFNHDGIINRD